MTPTLRKAVDGLEPMYARVGREIPKGRHWTFEPKYDGVRVLARVDASGVRLITRNGNDKARQFPEITSALAELATTRRGRGSDSVARHVRISPSLRGKGDVMLRRARAQGWEGLIAKRTDAPYQPGQRSDDWLKLKIEFEQEFVVGGFTEPRNTRENIGALLLGYFNGNGKLVYVGHTGGGFTRAGLAEMRARLDRLVRKTPPFESEPRTNEPATWVRPQVVVEVKFSEWTDDGRLRQPIYLGTRDDKDARDVTRESVSIQR